MEIKTSDNGQSYLKDQKGNIKGRFILGDTNKFLYKYFNKTPPEAVKIEENIVSPKKATFADSPMGDTQELLNSPSVKKKIQEFKKNNQNHSDQDLKLYLKDLVRGRNVLEEMNRTNTSTKEKNESIRPITVKSLLMSKHLCRIRDIRSRSEERKLKKHAKMEQDWDKFSSFVQTKVSRPQTGVSLIHASNVYREKKINREIPEIQDPNQTQYGRSVWLSSLRSNEKVDKWPYNVSIKKYKRSKTKVSKRQNYPDFIHSYWGTHYAYTVKPMRKLRTDFIRKSSGSCTKDHRYDMNKTQGFSRNKNLRGLKPSTTPVAPKFNTLTVNDDASKTSTKIDFYR
ncbi:unnamed protein product [Moneuplotes crassus]|uniref:Uncharacterized protein n=1 Tax=Euplotes crassus TaxID=5936 RepID=A0AAD1UDN1_EUPCR|nr:unnamed protein product [Moneuplotes crassus]